MSYILGWINEFLKITINDIKYLNIYTYQNLTKILVNFYYYLILITIIFNLL